MKVAILGNGPSRIVYSAGDHDLVIGCNIPWAPVNITVIVDCAVITKLLKSPDLIPPETKICLSTRAETVLKKKTGSTSRLPIVQSLLARCDKTFTIKDEWHSSGHCAALIAILMGATELELYGFDSVFDTTLESYTSEHIKSVIPPKDRRRIAKWRAYWKKIMAENPQTTFKFVRGIDDYTTDVSDNIS